MHRVSAVETPGGNVRYHSSVIIPQLQPPCDSLREVIEGWGHRSLLWSLTMTIQGDGSQIRRGMLLHLLLVVHDGSYQCKVAMDVCLGAVVIRCNCKWTGLHASCAWTEKTDRRTANNY